MKHRLTRMSVHQTAKVVAIVYAILSLLFIPVFILAALFDPNTPFGSLWLAFLAPVFYAVFGYIFTAISVALYNLVAGMTGGIEFELSNAPGAAPPQY